MKKLSAALIVIIVAFALWHFTSKKSAQAPDVEVQQTVTRPDPSDATFDFEDGPVTLKNGESNVVFPGGITSTDTTLSDESTVYGDVNGDGDNDAIVLLVQNSGGSGVFVYIAAYVSGNVAYKGSNAVFVGDRISPQSITVSSTGVITLTYLDRRPDEAMAAAPTVSTTKQYVLRDGTLEEK